MLSLVMIQQTMLTTILQEQGSLLFLLRLTCTCTVEPPLYIAFILKYLTYLYMYIGVFMWTCWLVDVNSQPGVRFGLVCWSLTSLCHSNGHIETMPTREINHFTALTRIRSQCPRTQWSTSNHQRVNTTAPQTAQPSGLASQEFGKVCQWAVAVNK